MYITKRILLLFFICALEAGAIYDTSTTSVKNRRHSNDDSDNPANWADDSGIWSTILEEWALRPSGVR